MTTYFIEIVTTKNTSTTDFYWTGNNYQSTIKIQIEANNKEEAIAIASERFPKPNNYIVKNSVKTIEEIAEDKRKEEEKLRKEEEAKIRKANKELEKANAMGLTLEEYKEYKKEEARKKRYMAEIRKAKAKIEELEKTIAYYENKLK
jgi:hypothetical protein